MTTLTPARCAGCGSPLPPSRGRRPRKWCSERCRKTQYGSPCERCGQPTNGSDGAGAHRWCQACNGIVSGERRRAEAAILRARVEQMWADGKTMRQIGKTLGWSEWSIQSGTGRLRAQGYNLPYRRTPEQRARIIAGTSKRLAKARAKSRKARPKQPEMKPKTSA